jgi:hypothetical protein
MSRGLLVVIGLCLVIVGAGWLVKGAIGLPTGVITYQQVLTRPEAHLYYPGSHVAESHGEGEQPSVLESDIPAYVQTYLVASDATPQQVDE